MGALETFNKYNPWNVLTTIGQGALKPLYEGIDKFNGEDTVDKSQATSDVLNGKTTLNDYSISQRDQLQQYWSTDTAFQQGLSDPQRQVIARSMQTQAALEANNKSIFWQPTEWVGAQLQWVMSESVSPLLSTVGIAAHHMAYGYDKGEDMGFGTTWREAHHISPGQALWNLTQSNEELRKRGIAPLKLSQADTQGYFSLGPGKREQTDSEKLKAAYFSEGPQKWISGTADFAVNWWLDPVVLAGKSTKFAKTAAYDRPVNEVNTGFTRVKEFGKSLKQQREANAADLAKSEQIAPAGGGNLPNQGVGPITRGQAIEHAKATGLERGRGLAKQVTNAIAESRYGNRVEGLSDSPALLAMRDHIQSYKDLYAHDPEQAIARLRTSMDTFRHSADGDTLSRAVLAARDESELLEVLRVSTGDVEALQRLRATNADLGAQMDVARSEYDNLAAKNNALAAQGQTMTPLSPMAHNQTMMDIAQSKYETLERESGRINQMLDSQGKIRNLYFNAWATPKMQKATEIIRGDRAPSGLMSSALATPIKMLNSAWNGIKPAGFVDVHDLNSHLAVDAIMRDAKFAPDSRMRYLGKYIAADQAERGIILMQIEADAVKRMAAKYGVSDSTARQLYESYNRARNNLGDSLRSYTSAKIENPDFKGSEINASEFRVLELDGDGAQMIAHPILATQIMNNHMVMNFEVMEKVLRENGEALSRMQKGARHSKEFAANFADITDRYWKVATLARLGYPVRAVADDLLGQGARFGAINLANRAFKGVYRSKWIRGVLGRSTRESDLAQAALLEQHVADLSERAAAHEKNIYKAQQRAVMHGKTSPAKRRKALARADRLKLDLQDVQNEISESRRAIGNLNDKHSSTVMEQVFSRGTLLPGAYEGGEGAMFRDLNSGARNTANLMGRPADWYLREGRTSGWVPMTVAKHGEEAHMRAWLRDINGGIRNDPLAMEMIRNGGDINKGRAWLMSPEGSAHFTNLGLSNISRKELVERVNAHVDHYLPHAAPGMDSLRKKILTEELNGKDLDIVDVSIRPEVNAELLQYAMGKGKVARSLDASITGFYKLMNEMPTQYLLKNPLFAQLYRGSIREQMAAMEKQGMTHMTEDVRRRLITNARQQALRDTKRFTFSMDHETKFSHNLRFVVPFIGAQQESWNRWARIFTEKPDMIGKGVLLYTSPMRSGHAVDQDGDPVVNGYATKEYRDPKTGEIKTKKVLVSRADIMVQVPEYLGGNALGKFFGGDGKTALQVPMSSLNFTLPSDFGTLQAGPYAQISANWFVNNGGSAETLPERAALMRSLGILPFGPSEGLLDPVKPAWYKAAFETGENSEQYQKWMFDTMAAEDYRFHTGERKTAPTWAEIKERADHHWVMNLLSKESGFNPKAQNPYQFFVTEQRKMQDLYGQDEGRARYIQKYGDSAFNFAQSMSKNNAGIRATKGNLEMYGELKAVADNLQNPELIGVLVGDDSGAYDSDAQYALRHAALQSGSGQKLLEKQSAREAWKAAQVQVGWQRYNSVMNQLDADLFDLGFASYGDPGAEMLKERRDKLVTLFGEPEVDGQSNPYYNPSWVEEFNTFDKGKYDSRAKDLAKALESPILQSKAGDLGGVVGMRSDLISLSSYLNARMDVERELAARKEQGGSDDITADANADLRDGMGAMIDSLKERDTRFGNVFNRYFGSDMGYGEYRNEQYASGELNFQAGSAAPEQGLSQALETGGF